MVWSESLEDIHRLMPDRDRTALEIFVGLSADWYQLKISPASLPDRIVGRFEHVRIEGAGKALVAGDGSEQQPHAAGQERALEERRVDLCGHAIRCAHIGPLLKVRMLGGNRNQCRSP